MTNNRKNKICITGGAGLIGSCLAEQLIKYYEKIIIIDDFSTGQKSNLSHILNQIEIREGNLEDQSFCKQAFEDCDVIYHLASRAYGIGYSSQNHLKMLMHNENINNNVLNMIKNIKPKIFLIASSSCIYDEIGTFNVTDKNLFRGMHERANIGYGWAKRFLEIKSNILSEEENIELVVARPFNIYGENYIIHIFLRNNCRSFFVMSIRYVKPVWAFSI